MSAKLAHALRRLFGREPAPLDTSRHPYGFNVGSCAIGETAREPRPPAYTIRTRTYADGRTVHEALYNNEEIDKHGDGVDICYGDKVVRRDLDPEPHPAGSRALALWRIERHRAIELGRVLVSTTSEVVP